eukprot:841332-Pelagomonas_calceolata.AAC.1
MLAQAPTGGASAGLRASATSTRTEHSQGRKDALAQYARRGRGGRNMAKQLRREHPIPDIECKPQNASPGEVACRVNLPLLSHTPSPHNLRTTLHPIVAPRALTHER